jgi:hypothetical protein
MTPEEFNKKLDQLEIVFQLEFLARVREKSPVRTGFLRDSWYWDNSNPDEPVFTTVCEYATFVENGTEFQRPQMMVATTVLEAPDILRQASKVVGL